MKRSEYLTYNDQKKSEKIPNLAQQILGLVGRDQRKQMYNGKWLQGIFVVSLPWGLLWNMV